MASFMFFFVALSRLAKIILNTRDQSLDLYLIKYIVVLNRFPTSL
jgi:hypothetical protein